MFDTGQPAPDFTMPQEGGDPVTLSELAPAPVVLFFYPRDDTSGCTKEAVAFSERLQEFTDAGIKVFGVSKDTLTSHARFRAKHDLTVPLLSDSETDTCERYGVWVEKRMYGKTYMGIERSTVLIGRDGEIARVWRKVKVAGHVEEVLAAASDL